MKKLLVVCIAVVGLLMGCGGGDDSPRFEFNESDFSYVTGGSVYLHVYFTANGDIEDAKSAWRELTLRLRHPDGTETEDIETDAFYTTFLMSSGFEAPKAGSYTVTAEDQSGKIIDTYTLDFIGPSMTINNVSPTWARAESPGCYTLEEVDFEVINGGDLPTWIAAIDICIEGSCQTVPPFIEDPARFLESPPKGVTLSLFSVVNIGEISPGEKTLSIEIRDSAGNIACTYSSNVTPSA